jgi:hypothetical protein
MGHDRDIDLADGPDDVGHVHAPLDLDRFGATLLDHPSAVTAGFVGTGLVGHERHVGYNQRFGIGPPDCPGMINHLVHGYRQCCIVTGKDNSGRITHQDHVNAATVNQAGKGEVVGGQHRDAATVLLHLNNFRYGDFFSHKPSSKL